MTEESSSTSFQLSSQSSGYQYGLPTIDHSSHRDSSSGASSGTPKSRKQKSNPKLTKSTQLKGGNSRVPGVGKPPPGRMIRDTSDMEAENGEMGVHPLRGRLPSSPPPLVDMSHVPVINAEASSTHLHRHESIEQSNAMHVQDNRQVLIQQVVNDPSVVEHLAASAAASEVRARAAEVVASTVVGAEQRVSNVINEATQAVVSARSQTETARTETEAVRVAASAHVNALSSEVGALRDRETMFLAQLESLRQENQSLREMVASSSGVATGHPANDPESLNGRLLVSIQERLLNIESELGRLGKKMDTHQEYLQELWYSQAPVPNVQEPGSPVFRMDEKDNEGFFGWDEGPQWNPGQEGQEVQSSAGSSEDVEKRSLRTKDLHHLKLPNLPNDASG